MHPAVYVAFPHLAKDDHEETSPQDHSYNCIAFAAGDTKRWWEPVQLRPGGLLPPGPKPHWPIGVPRVSTIEAYVAAYQTEGYKVCDVGELEEGFEKVAIYQLGERPTHAARQLPNVHWTSKLGKAEDIRHATLHALEDSEYGSPAVFMRRERSAIRLRAE